jgi:hypothetical protein
MKTESTFFLPKKLSCGVTGDPSLSGTPPAS